MKAKLVHPFTWSIAAYAHAAITLFNDLRILCHLCTYFRCRSSMPVRSRKQADADSDGRADFSAVKRQVRREVKRNKVNNAKAKQQCETENRQFKQAHQPIGEYLFEASFAKGVCESKI